MRIIAGEWKGYKLFMVDAPNTRPTTDFLKEVMFSVLFDCTGLRVLDLFAGSGALGLEALSRGAAHATFVDYDERALAAIRRNIEKLDCRDRCTLHRKKASSFLAQGAERYDLILLDPPYEHKLVLPTLEAITAGGCMAPGGRILAEHSAHEPVPDGWTYQKRFGDSMITILQEATT